MKPTLILATDLPVSKQMEQRKGDGTVLPPGRIWVPLRRDCDDPKLNFALIRTLPANSRPVAASARPTSAPPPPFKKQNGASR